MGDAYITGHRPPESFKQLVSRLNATSPIMDDGEKPIRRRKGKRSRIVARAELLTQEQLSMLIALLEGERVLFSKDGENYAMRKTSDGYSVQGMDGTERSVNRTLTECSCEDSRFRRRECKHIRALKVLI